MALSGLTSDEALLRGAYVALGKILCPGAGHLGEQVTRARKAKLDDAGYLTAESRQEIIDQQRRMDLVDALTMGVKDHPDTLETLGGRPAIDGRTPGLLSMTVICPAIQGKVNCANAVVASGPIPHVPDVPAPPSVADANHRPKECLQAHTAIHLTPQQGAKMFGKTVGSFEYEDFYSSMRSANERSNAHFKSPFAGGGGGHFAQLHGTAKNGLLAAITAAVSNETLIKNFDVLVGPDGNPPRATRRALYDKRMYVISTARKAGELAPR